MRNPRAPLALSSTLLMLALAGCGSSSDAPATATATVTQDPPVFDIMDDDFETITDLDREFAAKVKEQTNNETGTESQLLEYGRLMCGIFIDGSDLDSRRGGMEQDGWVGQDADTLGRIAVETYCPDQKDKL